MCGIVGYVGRRPGKPIILDGLRRLEYRGYDSAGIALIEDDGLDDGARRRQPRRALRGRRRRTARRPRVGLGHTRWATHGRPSEENAHPHDDCSGRVSIVLNGIIENYKELRAELTARGHTFTTETDAEVVAHLIEEHVGERPRRRPCAPPLAELRGPLRLLRHLGRRAGRHRRHAPRGAAGGRRRRGRDVLRLRHPGLPGAHAPGGRARGRRRRHAPRRRRGVHRRRRRAAGARGDARSPGTTTRPRRAATRRSCSRRSTSSRRRCATRSPAACARTAPSTSREVGHGRRVAAPPAAHLHRRLRHLVPRRPHRQLRHRGAGARAGADRRGQRVPLPRAGVRPGHAGHRHHAVGRDGRHARRHAARPRGRLAGAGAHQHHGQPGHARRRLRAVHARRPGDRRGGDQDAHRPGRRPARCSRCASPGRAAPCPRPSSSALGHELRAVPELAEQLLARPQRHRARSPSATTTSASSSTWGATWASPSAWRAPSSSRRSATSPPRPTPPAR